MLGSAASASRYVWNPTGFAPGTNTREKHLPLLPTRQTRSARTRECRATSEPPLSARFRYVMISHLILNPWTDHCHQSAALPDVCLRSVSPMSLSPARLLETTCEARRNAGQYVSFYSRFVEILRNHMQNA